VALVGFSLQFVVRMTSSEVPWQPYTDVALQQAPQENKIALVKFTATWCGNCQAIDATVFHDAKVVDALRKHGVVSLKADLTDKHAPGEDLLTQLSPGGGIPLTAIWAPGMDQPVKLSSVYSSATLLKILDQLDGM
jgi:thiol:disulfide interchange protein